MPEAVLHRISDHVYWMPPGKPDRPSVCAVVGTNGVLMLDAGASDAHARQFLNLLTEQGIPPPQHIVLTHWHWDHVFGAAEIGAQLIAHHLTAEKLTELSTRDWSDAGLDQQIALGTQTAKGADNIKTEMPTPRIVRIAQPDIVFRDSLELRLGAVNCRIAHVGGDHAADSSIMFIEPDRVLFLGDCLYEAIYASKRHYTAWHLLPLLDRLQAYDASWYVEGHEPAVSTRAEFDTLTGKLRDAVGLVNLVGPDEGKVFSAAAEKSGAPPDEEMASFLRAVIAGISP